MARIILFVVAAAAILVVLWIAFWSLLHLLVLGFWIVLVVLVGFGLFRLGRWSRSRQQGG
jgi:hypothetical protein